MTYFSDNHAGNVRQHVTELCINNEYVISDGCRIVKTQQQNWKITIVRCT